jgi:hypothetical protein
MLAAILTLITSLHGLEASKPAWETPGGRPSYARDGAQAGGGPAEYTDHFKCTITKVLPDNVLMVKDDQTRSFHYLELTPKTSVKAIRKSKFGGRKKLEFEDLAAGHQIKVTYLITTGEILKVHVLGKASGPD